MNLEDPTAGRPPAEQGSEVPVAEAAPTAEPTLEGVNASAEAAQAEISQTTREFAGDTDAQLASAAQSMDVSPETVQEMRTEEGLDGQLAAIDAEAVEAGEVARSEVAAATPQADSSTKEGAEPVAKPEAENGLEDVSEQPNWATTMGEDAEYVALAEEIDTAHTMSLFGTTDFKTIPLDRFMNLVSSDNNMRYVESLRLGAVEKKFRERFPERAAHYDGLLRTLPAETASTASPVLETKPPMPSFPESLENKFKAKNDAPLETAPDILGENLPVQASTEPNVVTANGEANLETPAADSPTPPKPEFKDTPRDDFMASSDALRRVTDGKKFRRNERPHTSTTGSSPVESATTPEAEAAVREVLAEVELSQNTGEQVPTPNNFREQILVGDLAYQDAEVPDEMKESMRQSVLSGENANAYAATLETLSFEKGHETLRLLAGELRTKMLSEAERLGVPVSPIGHSISWAMWDIGKQEYFFTHPDENSSEYELGDPMVSSEKQEEIINRHLGWEAYNAFKGNEKYRETISQSKNQRVLELFAKEPKPEVGTLSSKDLAELGKELRKEDDGKKLTKPGQKKSTSKKKPTPKGS